MDVDVRPMISEDKPAVMGIVKLVPQFSQVDYDVAEEVIDIYLQNRVGSGYFIYVAVNNSEITGYIAYGPTPLTDGTWDIYWMAVNPERQGKGIGRLLLSFAESEIKKTRARLIMIETSSVPLYEPTRKFFVALQYEIICQIPDFYSPGDGKVLYWKRV